MVSTSRTKRQNENQFGQLDKTVHDFIIGNFTNADAVENETSEPQTSGLIGSCGRFTVVEFSAS